MMRSFMMTLALLVCTLPSLATAATTSTSPKRHASSAMRPKVSLQSARSVASAKVPGGRIKSHELEREHGHLIYSFEFVVPGKPGIDEVNVDAMNGTVLAVEHESPKAERREGKQEAAEANKSTTLH